MHSARAAALEKRPAGQAQQAGGDTTVEKYVPMAQGIQEAEEAGATDPVGHWLQLLAPFELKKPAAQGVH